MLKTNNHAPIQYPHTDADALHGTLEDFQEQLDGEPNLVGLARHEPRHEGAVAVSAAVEPYYVGTEADRLADEKADRAWKKLEK